MKKSRFSGPCRMLGWLVAAVLVAVPNLLSAQEDEGPFYVTARLFDGKSGSEPEFEAAIGDIAASLTDQGRAFFVVYERIRGDLPGYVIYTPDADYNNERPLNVPAALVARVTSSVEGNTRLTMAVETGLETNIPENGQVPEIMSVRVFNVPPSNVPAFEDFLRETVVPALRDAGVMSRTARVVMGGSLGTYVIFVYTNEFPNGVGQLLQRSMGQRNFDRMNDQGRALISNVEDFAYRYRADLSAFAD